MSFLKNRTVVGVICILLSLLICFGLTPLFNRAVSQKAEIIRVVQPIRAGDKITESMVQTVEVGGYNLPEDVLRQKESAVGKYATADLAVGDYIIPTKLSDAPAAENAYLYNLDGSQQAISVSIKSFAEGLSGKLQSGDIVSVIAPDYKQQGQTVVPAELQYVEVISVTASSGYDANTGEPAADEEDDKELPDTVTLLVSPEQAKVLAELENINRCAEQALYYARSEHTEKDYSIREMNLADVVHGAIADNKYLLRQCDMAIMVDGLELVVYADDKWVRFILDQIVSNAVKYRAPQQPALHISAERADDRVLLSIADNGVGIPESDLPRIFEKGFTGQNERTIHSSTGIGLYLCKRLCDKLGIGLAASSTGRGTTITLSFHINDFITGVQG